MGVEDGTNVGVKVGLVGQRVVGTGVGFMVKGWRVGLTDGRDEGRKVYLDGKGLGMIVGFKLGGDGIGFSVVGIEEGWGVGERASDER